MFSRTQTFSSSVSRGTTILELMIAIAVIVILAGLAMVAVTATSQMSSTRETEGMMRTVKAMMVEYSSSKGEKIDPLYGNWSRDEIPFEPWKTQIAQGNNNVGGRKVGGGYAGANADPDIENQDNTERILFSLLKVPELNGYLLRKNMLKMLEDFDGDGHPELKDAWGKSIRYTDEIYLDMDGEPNSIGEPSADDLILHEGPSQFGFFVSAGPDGYFGDEDPKNGEDGWDAAARRKLAQKHAEDNIVSYSLGN